MKNRIIIGPYTIINLAKIGYQGKAYLMVTNSNEFDHNLTLKVFNQIPNVFLIGETIGKFDFIALAAFRDIKEIKKIVNKIRAHPSVEKVKVALTEQTDFPFKREYGPLTLLDVGMLEGS